MSAYRNKINKRLKRKAQLRGVAQAQDGISGFGPRVNTVDQDEVKEAAFNWWLGQDLNAIPGVEPSSNKKTQFESKWTRREQFDLEQQQRQWDMVPTINPRPTKQSTMNERNKKQTWLSQG
tara:strand:+ start:2179 stop:2541 length:363 start_codon:yes stop_codon:yes gene_type:complete